MKKLLVLLIATFMISVNAEIIDLDCRYKEQHLLEKDREVEFQYFFTIDANSKRMYEGSVEYILDIQPHFYIAYPRYLFDTSSLLLTEKKVYPYERWRYKIDRSRLFIYSRSRGVISVGHCYIIKNNNKI